MPFEQVKTILTHVQTLRQRVRDIAKRQEFAAKNDLVAALLGQAEEKDRVMQDLLTRHADGASQGVLETWVQFSDTAMIERELAEIGASREDGDEATLMRLLELDRRLLEIYQTASEQSRSERVKQFFAELAEMERQKARRRARNLTELDDLHRAID